MGILMLIVKVMQWTHVQDPVCMTYGQTGLHDAIRKSCNLLHLPVCQELWLEYLRSWRLLPHRIRYPEDRKVCMTSRKCTLLHLPLRHELRPRYSSSYRLLSAPPRKMRPSGVHAMAVMVTSSDGAVNSSKLSSFRSELPSSLRRRFTPTSEICNAVAQMRM